MWSQPRDEGGMGSTEVTTAQGMKHTRKETNNQKKVLVILLSLSWEKVRCDLRKMIFTLVCSTIEFGPITSKDVALFLAASLVLAPENNKIGMERLQNQLSNLFS